MVYSPGGTSWSQVGYRKNYGGHTYHWAQTERGSGYPPVDDYGSVSLTAGDTYYYETSYVGGDRCSNGGGPPYFNCLANTVGGQTLSITPWDVDENWGTAAWNWSEAEESVYVGGNVPGTSADPVGFGSVNRMEYEDSALNWQPADCDFSEYYNDDTAHYGHRPVATHCTHQQLFTYNPY